MISKSFSRIFIEMEESEKRDIENKERLVSDELDDLKENSEKDELKKQYEDILHLYGYF